MSSPSGTIQVIREWIEKAENDLKTAAHTLKMRDECPTDMVCFHAQQCAEKYLKALLVARAVPFPKTHNLRILVGLIAVRERPVLDGHEQDRLTDYATVMRYPGGGPDISLAEARKAVAIARRVRTAVRRLPPRATLRRRRK